MLHVAPTVGELHHQYRRDEAPLMRSVSISVAAPGECDVVRGSASPGISKWFGHGFRVKSQEIVDDGIGVVPGFGVGL